MHLDLFLNLIFEHLVKESRMASGMIFVLLLCSLLCKGSYGIELISSSKPKMIPQGDSYTLFCETDEPYEICKWSHAEQEKNCRVTSDEIEAKQGTECSDDSHLIWELTETSCGITIQNAARSDIGEYKCTVGVLEPEISILTETVSIDISVPAIVIFQGNFAEATEIQIDLETEAVVECHVTGGYPHPMIQAAIGQHKDYIDTEQADEILEVVDEQTSELDDGTYEVSKSFKFTAAEAHCGQYVKCEAVQKDGEGNILFQEQDVMSRKLSIVFGPQPLSPPLQPFNFTEGAESLEISIVFSANPIPANNQAIWHINPTGNASHESHVLQAGQEDGRYDALPLNNTQQENHGVRATLKISNPTIDDLENVNYLELIGTQKYYFTLQIVEFPIEPTDNLQNDDGDKTIGGQDIENSEAKGMGVGSVVAIVIVVAVICLIIGCVVYSKRTGKCCFEKYNGVPTKDVDDLNTHTSIIKNGGNVDSKLTKSVEAGVDETDEQKHIDNQV